MIGGQYFVGQDRGFYGFFLVYGQSDIYCSLEVRRSMIFGSGV